ncbi:MarR family transcriptional regulator [Patulibacter sp. SYSU D01012]|uniref:MarR family winged helix-turn-helix transcriptional regulator n=1 Tax=Patulibacter sp. SYSU D01012 TaxID=2817381 RepID=UPI001B31169F|nr:MarR family transcriptional regulator [Patulibacter sp. SYSU D01012]
MDRHAAGDARTELFEVVGVLARRRFQAAERAYAPLGLGHTEARLLGMLAAAAEGATQDALSRRLSVDRSNAGRALKRLEQAGHVERRRSPADSRTNLVAITRSGRALARRVADLRGQIADELFAGLSATEAAEAAALLRRASGDAGAPQTTDV